MDPMNAPGYCTSVGIGLQHLECSQRTCKNTFDDRFKAGAPEMVFSEVPVNFFHRCSTLLVMLH